MIAGKGTGSESWLKIACLAASFALHAGLGASSWQGFGDASVDPGPIMVTLVDSPSAATPQTLRPAAPVSRGKSAAVATAPPRRPSPPVERVATNQSSPAQGEVLQCAVPATAVVEPAIAMSPQELQSGGAGAVGVTINAGGEPAAGHVVGTRGEEGLAFGFASGGLTLAIPRYASNPKPEYPSLARQNRWEGVVQLRATISAAGEVESVVVENSSGHRLLDNSALGGVRRWRFVPARRGDQQVPCEVRIPVAFQLER